MSCCPRRCGRSTGTERDGGQRGLARQQQTHSKPVCKGTIIHLTTKAGHGVMALLRLRLSLEAKLGTASQNPISPGPFLWNDTDTQQTTPVRRRFWVGRHTCQEADPPEPRVQRQFDFGRLVLGLDDALLQVEPVVGADGDAQEAEAADGEHAAEQGQRLPAAGAHSQKHGGPRRRWGRLPGEGTRPSAQSHLPLFGGMDVSKPCPLPLIAYLGRAEIGH